MRLSLFRFIATDGNARHGEVENPPHGAIRTPPFMPVGTLGAMKGIHWHEVRDSAPTSCSPTPIT